MPSDSSWRGGDQLSRLLLDVAGGRPVARATQLDDKSVQLAHQHGLVGLMASSENALLRSAAFPGFVRWSARQEVMKVHLRRLLDLFGEAGIRATVLKGPYLAEFVYRQPSHRLFTDIDLLVPREDLDRALDVLRGYPPISSIPRKKPKADKREVPLIDPATRIYFNLDVHWDLFSYTQLLGASEGATEEAWARAEGPVSTALGPLWHLPDAAVLCFLCTHALLDHRFRLILYRDLTEVALRGPDWEEIGRFADRWGLRSSTYVALLIASRVTDAPVPLDFLSAIRPRSASIALTERLLPTIDMVRFDGHRPHPLNLAIVLLHDSPLGRLRLAVRAPFAFPKWMQRVAGTSEGVSLVEFLRPRTVPSRTSRVLHLLPGDLARGAQTYAKAMRNALDTPDVEHRVAMIFHSEGGPSNVDIDLGVRNGLGRRMGFSTQALLRLRRYLKSWQPEVVVAHGGEALKYAVFATGRSTKVAYYKIGSATDLLRNPLRRIFHRLLVRRADLVVGVSKEMVDEARHLLGARQDRTVYIPNGRDPSTFLRIASPGRRPQVQFVFVGHLTRTKRPERFTEVIGALRQRGIEAQGIVIGDGPMLEDCRRSSPSWIEFLGRRDDVPTLLSECDAFLFTSLAEGEGMPGVLIEAGLAGLPTVSTNVSGARTVIDDGVTGFVVAVDDARGFINAAERLARDPDLRVAMGSAARARCLEQFTLQSSIEVWEKHLFDLRSHVNG